MSRPISSSKTTASSTRLPGPSRNATQQGRSIQGEFWRGGAIATDFKHQEVLSRFAEKAVQYLESRAGSPQPFFLYLALTAPHPPWLPLEPFRGKSGAGMYGDFVMQMDEVLGRVVARTGEGSKDERHPGGLYERQWPDLVRSRRAEVRSSIGRRLSWNESGRLGRRAPDAVRSTLAWEESRQILRAHSSSL
jgi:hypothetical protein